MTTIAEPHSLADAVEVWRHCLETHDPEDVWFFVENSTTKKAVVRALGRSVPVGQITTLQQFADALVAGDDKDIHLLTTEEQLIMLQKIVCDSAWNSTNTSMSFIHELMGRYNFFRKNGISLDAYRGTDTKQGILCGIFDRYIAECGTKNLDSIGIIHKAIELVQTKKPLQCVIIYHLNPTELLLQELRDAIRDSSTEVTEYLVAEHEIEPPATLHDIRKYPTAGDEVEAVLEASASLIEDGCDPKDILILTPSLNESAGFIRDAIGDFYYRKDDAYLPLTCTSLGTSLSAFPIIQCVMAALSTQLSGFRLTDLETITSAHYFVWPKGKENQCITHDQLRELSIIANVTEKESGWKSAASRLNGDRNYGIYAEKIEPLLAWVKQIASPNPSRTFAERSARLLAWLAASGWSSYHVLPQEHAARSLFLQYLATISGSATGDVSCTLAEFVATIRQFIQEKQVPATAKNGIRLEKLRKAGDLKAKHVFIIALTADKLPNLTTALSPFSIAETNDLCRLPDGTPFSLPDRQFAETRENFAAALLAAEEDLHLSCYQSNGSTSSAASSFLTKLGEPETVPKIMVKHSVWYNQIEAGTRIRKPEEAYADEPLLGIADTAGLAERIYREKNGHASDFSTSSVKDLFTAEYADREYYPTEIETYLGCPYRWYLDKHLRLRNPQESHAEHLQLGTLVHDALEEFFSTHPAEQLAKPEEFDALYTGLLSCVKKQFDKEHILDSPSWDAQKDWYLDRIPGHEGIMKQFLKQETAFAKEGWVTTEEMTEYKLNDPEPVDITFHDRTMKIGGKIDRIMRKGDTFRVVDYKTGTSFEEKMKKGKLVQLPLYTAAYAAKSALIPEKGYYFELTNKSCQPVFIPTHKRPKETEHDLNERLLAATFDAKDGMSSGNCSRAEKCTDTYCPYKSQCRASNIAEDESDD